MIFEGFSLAARPVAHPPALDRGRGRLTTIAVSATLNLIVGAVPLLVVAGLLAA